MAERILFFESDPYFANQVKSHFEQLGVTVDVVADGPTGLQWAEEHPPHLILLTVELRGMNGFLVCKRLKKNETLRSVPLVILSSDAAAETFEQHKKLRTRADGYIHKPVSPPDLQAQLEDLLLSEGEQASSLDLTQGEALRGMAPPSEAPPTLVVADYEEWASSELGSESSSQGPALEDFANAAFDSLMMAPPALPRPKLGTESPLPPAPRAFRASSERPRVGNRLASSRSSSVPVRAAAAPLAATVQTAHADREETPVVSVTEPQATAELEAKAVAADHARALAEERVASAEKALAELEAKVVAADHTRAAAEERAVSAEKALTEAHRRGGAASREFLDLREQLNRKDRELLDLRDQIAARDKQMVEANDHALTAERDLADLRDEHAVLQREAEKNKDLARTLTEDREGAKKREDDLKARLQRAEAKLREAEDELEGAKAHYGVQIEAVHRDHAAAVARLEADYAARADELGQQREQAEGALREELVRLKRELDSLVQERDSTHAKVEQLTDRHRAELMELRRTQDVAIQRAADDVRAELEDQLEAVTQVHRREMSASSETYQTELAQAHAALAMSKEAHQKELSHLGRALSEADTRNQSLAERLEESESVRQSLSATLEQVRSDLDRMGRIEAELRGELERLSAQMAHDAQVVERVRRAMAIGLGLLDQRTSDEPHHATPHHSST